MNVSREWKQSLLVLISVLSQSADRPHSIIEMSFEKAQLSVAIECMLPLHLMRGDRLSESFFFLAGEKRRRKYHGKTHFLIFFLLLLLLLLLLLM
jgi:hypothetical protein